MSIKSDSPEMNLTSLAIWLIASVLGRTWRVKIKTPEAIDPFNDQGYGRIYCFWHSQLLPLSFVFRNTGKTALVSQSRDGRIAAAVAKCWKHDIVFGSSSHNRLSALRQCVRILKEKKSIVLTPDGPRGPAEIVKSGVAQIAFLSRAPVVPVVLFTDRSWRLKSWDRFIIPKPFARVDIILGDPICTQQYSDNEDFTESLRALIQEKMDALSRVA